MDSAAGIFPDLDHRFSNTSLSEFSDDDLLCGIDQEFPQHPDPLDANWTWNSESFVSSYDATWRLDVFEDSLQYTNGVAGSRSASSACIILNDHQLGAVKWNDGIDHSQISRQDVKCMVYECDSPGSGNIRSHDGSSDANEKPFVHTLTPITAPECDDEGFQRKHGSIQDDGHHDSKFQMDIGYMGERTIRQLNEQHDGRYTVEHEEEEDDDDGEAKDKSVLVSVVTVGSSSNVQHSDSSELIYSQAHGYNTSLSSHFETGSPKRLSSTDSKPQNVTNSHISGLYRTGSSNSKIVPGHHATPTTMRPLSRSSSGASEHHSTTRSLSRMKGSSFGRPVSQPPRTSQSTKPIMNSPHKLPLRPAVLNTTVNSGSTSPQARKPGPISRLVSLPVVDGKMREDVRLDLRGQKVKSLDCSMVNLTAKLEFVYLRDNKLSNLAGIEILRRVKVLDLSFNEFKGLGMEPLASCKALQQLYLAGNQMTSLTSLPQLPNLEFLSVAQNRLKGLAMVSQPKLQVLAASKNKISTFKGFPHLPCLEHLRIEENPLSDMPHVEAAAILLAGPTLKRFNNRDIMLQEQELAYMYPPHSALCIRDGWEFCDVDKAFDSSMRFLAAQWAERIPGGYSVDQAFIEQPSEGYPCRCHFTFNKHSNEFQDFELRLRYQWFIGGKTPSHYVPIQGAVNEVYWPKHSDIGRCLKVECILAHGPTAFGPIFAVSFPVLPGTGCPKVLELNVIGDVIEGSIIQGHAEVAWCGGTATKGFVSWLRHTDERLSPVMVPGAEDMEYQLSLDDVGSKMILMYTPVTAEGIKGEPRFATTEVIRAARPSVSDLQVHGDMVEDNTVSGIGKYFGGIEGRSKFEWLQEDIQSGTFRLISEGSAELTLTEEDVGLRMMFRYTPVNSEGHQGTSVSVITGKVRRAPPKVTHLKIVGDVNENSSVNVSASISGSGVEGASRIQWFKTHDPDGLEDMQQIGSSGRSEDFKIPLGAVGFYLVAKYTPVLSDDVTGEPAIVVSDTPVEMLPPSVNSLSMTGEHREGEVLSVTYSYVGGYEGKSQYTWFLHEHEGDPGIPVQETGLLWYRLTKEAINKFVSFKCIPIREDGVVGEEKVIMGKECVKPGSPKVVSLNIVGEPIEGSVLQVAKRYSGGFEGHSKIQWFQINTYGARKAIEGVTDDRYTITTEDINHLICVSYEPCRSDDVRGPVMVSQPIGPVLPAPPSCEVLEIVGEPIEGGNLTFTADYKGGVKGNCTCMWIRQRPNGVEQKLSVRDTLNLTLEDVGCHIKLVYTPVRRDGVRGQPKSVLSDVIKEGEPTGLRLAVPSCYEDMPVSPQKSYFGGIEGDSDFTWFRLQEKLQGSINFSKAQIVGRSESYTPKLEDVGSYLALLWIPVRKDGKKGKPCVACSNYKVSPAPPSVHSVGAKEVSPGLFIGEGMYHGGIEGMSQMRWYRQAMDGSMTPIPGAISKIYAASEEDYTCSLVFGFTPVREDGVVGRLILSEPTDTILPELPSLHKLVLTGKVIEGEVLTAKEVIPKSEKQQIIWEKYIKEIRYQWSRSYCPDLGDSYEMLLAQQSCSYTIRTEDIGFSLRCECVVTDIFGRSSIPVSVVSSAVEPGVPTVDKLEIEGRGYHTDIYAVRGSYSGGREGRSAIQWFRAMARSPDLIPIVGGLERVYQATIDDIGCRLVAVYTPVREDGAEGIPASASIGPIKMEPAIAEEVEHKLHMGVLRFEALLDPDHSTTTENTTKPLGSLEKRVIDVNKERIKVMKAGTMASSVTTEMGEEYSPPYHVEANKEKPHCLRILTAGKLELNMMVQSRQLRDTVALVIKELSNNN